MGVKVRGIRQAKANLDRIIKDLRGRKVVSAIQKAMIIGGAQASFYTPIDTNTLINSQFREIITNGTRVTGRVGYSANYAVYVHDPAVKQNFTRATARKEFLTKGFEDTRSQIDAAVKKELSL
ncbi:HK97 gp10 family phage protein [Klebsiella sp. 141153]|uniref:HK97 gp10 family phage protein n=1 Tax=Klebsiella sp. 141153 TaxID=3020033 RepID=UPI002928D5A0|nr:HK97 gp10 family phage protein [Klebsiella sp. 141153]MDU9355854.1 HK97 gp10 family phage protein [Klebsiella sp. 141153]